MPIYLNSPGPRMPASGRGAPPTARNCLIGCLGLLIIGVIAFVVLLNLTANFVRDLASNDPNVIASSILLDNQEVTVELSPNQTTWVVTVQAPVHPLEALDAYQTSIGECGPSSTTAAAKVDFLLANNETSYVATLPANAQLDAPCNLLVWRYYSNGEAIWARFSMTELLRNGGTESSAP